MLLFLPFRKIISVGFANPSLPSSSSSRLLESSGVFESRHEADSVFGDWLPPHRLAGLAVLVAAEDFSFLSFAEPRDCFEFAQESDPEADALGSESAREGDSRPATHGVSSSWAGPVSSFSDSTEPAMSVLEASGSKRPRPSSTAEAGSVSWTAVVSPSTVIRLSQRLSDFKTINGKLCRRSASLSFESSPSPPAFDGTLWRCLTELCSLPERVVPSSFVVSSGMSGSNLWDKFFFGLVSTSPALLAASAGPVGVKYPVAIWNHDNSFCFDSGFDSVRLSPSILICS
mmetsp:Transcript_17537/g.36046  ORF Transcript_17537/g.36046 Transcript_17537/m.36046 type:complete len:287 (-) Transcript_17537:69-929(-)